MLLPPRHVPEALRQAIVAAFPDLAGADFSVAGLGWHSLAVEADGRLIFKFPQGAEAEQALLREARLMGAVRPFVTMPIPDMSIHRGPPLFSWHGKLPGRTLEQPAYASLGEKARNRLADDIATFFSQLHVIPPKVMHDAPAKHSIGAAYSS